MSLTALWLYPSKQLGHTKACKAYHSPNVIYYNLVSVMMKELATYSQYTMYVWSGLLTAASGFDSHSRIMLRVWLTIAIAQ